MNALRQEFKRTVPYGFEAVSPEGVVNMDYVEWLESKLLEERENTKKGTMKPKAPGVPVELRRQSPEEWRPVGLLKQE